MSDYAEGETPRMGCVSIDQKEYLLKEAVARAGHPYFTRRIAARCSFDVTYAIDRTQTVYFDGKAILKFYPIQDSLVAPATFLTNLLTQPPKYPDTKQAKVGYQILV